MKVFIFTLLSCFWGNAYLGSYSTPYRSTSMCLYLAKASSLSGYRRFFLEPSQGFPVGAGALSASTPHGGLALRASLGTGQPQAVPFFPPMTGDGRGATAGAKPCPWKLLFSWASAVWPPPELQLPPRQRLCLATAAPIWVQVPSSSSSPSPGRCRGCPGTGAHGALTVPCRAFFSCVVQEMVIGSLFPLQET